MMKQFLTVLFSFFSHIHISLLTPQVLIGNKPHKTVSVLTAEPDEAEVPDSKCPGSGCVLTISQLGTRVGGSSFWKRATTTTRIQVPIFV